MPQPIFNPLDAAGRRPHLQGRLNQITIFHILCISIVITACSIFCHKGGMAHPEADIYLPYYISDKPLLNKIYDSKVVDLDLYNCRELSYLFDYFDCRFIQLSVALGFPHLLSITTYLFLIGTALILWHFSVRILGSSPILGLALVLLFWTSPSIFLAGNYFRSAKYGVALVTAALFLLLYRFLAQPQTKEQPPFSKSSWLMFFATSWIAMWFDRQGFYFIAMAICFLIFWNCVFPQKKLKPLISALVAAFALNIVYNLVIGRHITMLLNGYLPSLEFQQLPLSEFTDYCSLFLNLQKGISLYLDTVRFMTGSLPSPVVGTILTTLIVLILADCWKEKKQNGKMSPFSAAAIGLIVCTVFFIVALNMIMVVKHSGLLLPDVRRVYYWVPTVTLLLMTLALALSQWKAVRERSKCFFLGLAILGNVYALPQHHAICRYGQLEPYFDAGPELLEALKNLDNTNYQPSPEILANPIYQCFRQRKVNLR